MSGSIQQQTGTAQQQAGTAPLTHNTLSDTQFFTIYDKYIDYIRHENELIHQRTTWLVTTQGAFLLILSYLIQKYFEVTVVVLKRDGIKELDLNQKQQVVLFMVFWFIVCATGLASLYHARLSIIAAFTAQNELNKKWKTYFLDRADMLKLPAILGGGDEDAHKHGATFARSFPKVLIPVWLAFIAYGMAIVYFVGLKLVFEVALKLS